MRIDNILRLVLEFHVLFLKVCWWRGLDKSSSLLRPCVAFRVVLESSKVCHFVLTTNFHLIIIFSFTSLLYILIVNI
jgi:hypothetical protein